MLEQKEVKLKSWIDLLSAKKNIAGRLPETIRTVVQNDLYPNLDKIRISKKTLEITETVDQYNIKALKFFQFRGVSRCCWWGGGGT